jgi:hypothetical protein
MSSEKDSCFKVRMCIVMIILSVLIKHTRKIVISIKKEFHLHQNHNENHNELLHR